MRFNIPFLTKKKEKERLFQERQIFLDNNIEHSNKIQEETKDTQKSTLEIEQQNLELMQKNYILNEQLVKVVAENKEKENLLLKREEGIKSSEHDVGEREIKVRKEEIYLEASKAETRKKEQEVSKYDEGVKVREAEAEKLKLESEENKEKYQNLFDELNEQKENIANLEGEAVRKNAEASEKETASNAIFEKAKVIDAEIKAKESEFEKKREDIEASLKLKIEEYDRKLEDINNIQEFVDDIKFDDSEDGKAAKIVVKEAIRQAKKSLTDIKTKFDELDEKYCGGTFKGFSTPVSEIDKSLEDLKAQYIQIKENIEANTSLPASINKWLDIIEGYINEAYKCIKSWEFSEGHRNIIFGLSTCRNYELLLIILSDWSNAGESSGEENTQEEFIDWYEELKINPEATAKEIKKQYRNLAKQYHPDKAIDEEQKHEFEVKMRLINQAWEILGDEEKRKEFDEKRKAHKG
jgi:hypothetical protein